MSEILPSSRSAVIRAAEAQVNSRARARHAPRVTWAGLTEDAVAFSLRVGEMRARSRGLVLAVVPHGLAVPDGVQPITLPEKCFRALHPSRPSRFKVLKGGRGAAKSWSIARALIALSLERPISVLCCREIQHSIRASVHKVLRRQIESLGLSRYFNIDVRAITAYNNSTFDFEGLYANVDRIKSFEGAHVCWIEEAENISADSWEILEPTLRELGSFFCVNYNPNDANAPTHQMFAIVPRPDAVVEHVTYLDNPYLTEPLRQSAEYMRSVDDDAFRHVWLGECRTHSDSQILKGKVTVEDFTPQSEWSGPHLGLDFGFSQDPTAAVRCYVHERTLFISNESWRIGCDIDKTPQLLDELGPDARKQVMRADNARPETISYLQQHGYPRVEAVDKWKGSVEDGIAHLRSYERIVVHPRCEHTIEECRLYSYKVDRLTSDVLPDVIDKFNHCIDALRYALSPLIKKPPGWGLFEFYRQANEKSTGGQPA